MGDQYLRSLLVVGMTSLVRQDQVAPGTRKQVAHFTAGTQTGTRRNCRHGQQDRTDRLGRSDPQRTIYTAHCLKEKEQRVSKTREMMVHKSAAKTKTPRRMSRAQLPA